MMIVEIVPVLFIYPAVLLLATGAAFRTRDSWRSAFTATLRGLAKSSKVVPFWV